MIIRLVIIYCFNTTQILSGFYLLIPRISLSLPPPLSSPCHILYFPSPTWFIFLPHQERLQYSAHIICQCIFFLIPKVLYNGNMIYFSLVHLNYLHLFSLVIGYFVFLALPFGTSTNHLNKFYSTEKKTLRKGLFWMHFRDYKVPIPWPNPLVA